MSQIDRSFEILELFFENPNGLSLSEVSSRTNIPMATAHRMLSFFKNRGYVYQDDKETYYLSLLLPSMGAQFFSCSGFSELLQPPLNRLAAETGEHIRLAAAVDSHLIWVLRAVVSSHGLQYRGVTDTKVVPHITASGKMWLSSLSDEEAVRVVSNWDLEHSREYGGPKGITSIKDLLSDLKKIREDGFAIIFEEAEIGVCAAAVGVLDTRSPGRMLGTISIAGPTPRLDRETLESKIPALKSTATQVQETWNHWNSLNAGPVEEGFSA